MPNITKQFHLDITPEQFLNACDSIELKELELLLSSPRFQVKMRKNWNPVMKTIMVDHLKFFGINGCHQCGCTEKDFPLVAENLCSSCAENSLLSR